MTKKVYRYFFDFLDSQQAWLNDMAAKGWRLVKCGQLAYTFESCEPGEYEYAVEFVADKSYAESKSYKLFLDGLGYTTFYKNINVGIYVGKATWRPWAKGAGQISTAPGSYQKELLIVEKRADGKPFELHTDLNDALPLFKTVRNAYMWSAGGMFALLGMCVSFAVFLSPFALIGALPCAVFAMLWLGPVIKFSSRVRSLKEAAATGEYTPEPAGKGALRIVLLMAVCAMLGGSLSFVIDFSGMTTSSGSALMLIENSGRNHWNASYKTLNGFRQRSVTLAEGTHTIMIETESASGELRLTIRGQDGTEYYSSEPLTGSPVAVQVAGGTKVKLRVDAKDHSGSYRITWD